MDRERLTTNFLNIGHFLDHLAMLIFPTALIAMSAELGVDYGDRLLLMIGGVVLFGAAAVPA
ncbi:MAG: MFS transporter, partial [Alphaproteobacteria bacterium]|nr:MFS transporter [Alphaproteobacteria bacterium]